jgi:hypothetical protein
MQTGSISRRHRRCIPNMKQSFIMLVASCGIQHRRPQFKCRQTHEHGPRLKCVTKGPSVGRSAAGLHVLLTAARVQPGLRADWPVIHTLIRHASMTRARLP